MHPALSHTLLSLLTTTFPAPSIAAKPKDAILLSEATYFPSFPCAIPLGISNRSLIPPQVQSLTLRANRKTAHRRVPAVPQLQCSGPRQLCDFYQVDTMRCINQGSSYGREDIEWACTADLPSTLKLGSTEVTCEGYSSSEDPYVLRGSCAVEYRLALTDEGERHHPELAQGGWGGNGSGLDWSGLIFGVIFLTVLAWILYNACVQAGVNARVPGQPRRRNYWGAGGGGWFPGDDDNDPPPPYPGTKPTTRAWRPGFWSGAAAGAAAGYMAGNRRDNTRQGGLFGGRGYDSYGSTWGSGRTQSTGSGSTSSRHESTGFGSTSRR